MTCTEVQGLNDHLALATVEGLPAIVVEPAHLLGHGAVAATTPSESASWLSREQPSLAVVIGHQGAVVCGLAADHARLWSGADSSADAVDIGTIRHFFGPL